MKSKRLPLKHTLFFHFKSIAVLRAKNTKMVSMSNIYGLDRRGSFTVLCDHEILRERSIGDLASLLAMCVFIVLSGITILKVSFWTSYITRHLTTCPTSSLWVGVWLAAVVHSIAPSLRWMCTFPFRSDTSATHSQTTSKVSSTISHSLLEPWFEQQHVAASRTDGHITLWMCDWVCSYGHQSSNCPLKSF